MENLENEVIQENLEQPTEQSEEIEPLYDYYDTYYQNVLSNMNTIITNQSTMIENQEQIIKHNNKVEFGLDVIIFLVGLYFVYQVLRNMIIIK